MIETNFYTAKFMSDSRLRNLVSLPFALRTEKLLHKLHRLDLGFLSKENLLHH